MGKVRNTGKLQTDVCSLAVDEAKIAHLHWTAEEAEKGGVKFLVSKREVGTNEVVITEFDENLPCTRRIYASVSADDVANIKAVSVIVEGTDIAGNYIKEILQPFKENAAGSVYSSKCFATIKKITVPKMYGAAIINIGFGSDFGIPFAFDSVPLAFAMFGGVLETAQVDIKTNGADIAQNYIILGAEKLGVPVDLYIFL